MPIQKARNILVWLLKPFSSRKKYYWRIVFLCFMAAATFWLLNALNKNYTTRISYPVTFIYNQQKLVPVKPLPDEVYVNVTGKGWKLLRKSLMFDVKPAELFLKNLPYAKYITGPALRPAISNALDGLQLNFVITDTLFFDFDFNVTRRIALAIDTTNIKLDEKFLLLRPIKINPDSVTFRGAASYIDSLPNPFLLPAPAEKLNKNFSGRLPINYANKALVQSNIENAEVEIRVTEILQEEQPVTPQLVNFPKEQLVTLDPAAVQVQYQYLKNNASRLYPDSFKVQLNFQKLNKADSTIIPEIIKIPKVVRSAKVFPEKVKVSIK